MELRDKRGEKPSVVEPESWREVGRHFAVCEWIMRDRPGWVVIWGPASRLYRACPVFVEPPRLWSVSDTDPERLITRMKEVEQFFGARLNILLRQLGKGGALTMSEPGELMRRVGGKLAAQGFHLQYREPGDGTCVTITGGPGSGPGMRCELMVTDEAFVEWECFCRDGSEADPQKIADLITFLLTDREDAFPRAADGYPAAGITLKGIVGRELKARGLDVTLEVYPDEDFYQEASAIAAVNQDTADDATVWIDDEAFITWQHDYWADVTTATENPDLSWRLTDPGKLATTIADKITRAIWQTMPEPAPT